MSSTTPPERRSYDQPEFRQSALSATREPFVPPRQVLDMVSGRVLDPGTALTVNGVRPRSTVYVGPRLIVAMTPDAPEVISRLQTVAESLGWKATVHTADRDKASAEPREEVPGVIRLDLTVLDEKATIAPDGWILLQNARATYGIKAMSRVGLDHIVLLRSIDPNPFHHASPFHHATPFHHASASEAVSSYGAPGSGGRQPVAYAGPAPQRREKVKGRRPVVATLDTGCGKHDWLEKVVTRGPDLDGSPIGYVDDATDPETWFDQVGALDGGIDALAGHGTFIAGLIHQGCPDADIVTWRIVGSDGPVVESDMVEALRGVAELARRHRDGEGGVAIDVFSLSMGYYHETPEDDQFDPTLYDILRVMGECGVAVVCSAGNDATARPMFPAAFAPWADGKGGAKVTKSCVPVIIRGCAEPQRDRRPVQQCRPVGARPRTRRSGDEHPPADIRGGPRTSGSHRGLHARTRVHRPRRLRRRVRGVERDVVRSTALRGSACRAARRQGRAGPRRSRVSRRTGLEGVGGDHRPEAMMRACRAPTTS